MDVQKISNHVRMQKWMTIIDECSKSELPIQNVMRTSMMITITKGDIHIEVPDSIDQTTLMNIMRTLLC